MENLFARLGLTFGLEENLQNIGPAPQSVLDKWPERAQIASLTAEVERLRAELAFYADPDNWVSPSKGFAAQYDPEPSPVHKVRHHRAAAALQPNEGNQ